MCIKYMRVVTILIVTTGAMILGSCSQTGAGGASDGTGGMGEGVTLSETGGMDEGDVSDGTGGMDRGDVSGGPGEANGQTGSVSSYQTDVVKDDCYTVTNGIITTFNYDNHYSDADNQEQDCFTEALAIPGSIGGQQVTKIAAEVFDGSERTKKLKSVSLPDNLQTIGARAFTGNELEELIISYYDEDNNKLDGVLSIPGGVYTIGERAFADNKLEGELIIPDRVKTIGNSAFENNAFTSLNIPRSVETIGAKAFYNSPITDIFIDPHDNLVIEDDAFSTSFNTAYNRDKRRGRWEYDNGRWRFRVSEQEGYSCYTVNNGEILAFAYDGQYIDADNQEQDCFTPVLVIPGSIGGQAITGIGARVFGGLSRWKRLQEVILPDSVETIGEGAFANNGLSSVDWGNSVETIGDSAFKDNELSSVDLGNSVKTIGENAFANNNLKGELIIPDSVETIGKSAFRNNELTSVTLGSSMQKIEESVFRDNVLTSLTLGSSIQTIGYSAFAYNELRSVSIPKSVETIEEEAFYNTFNDYWLTDIFIDPHDNLVIEDDAFLNDFNSAYSSPYDKLRGTWIYRIRRWSFAAA